MYLKKNINDTLREKIRDEKNRDKISAESGECHTFTCDLMAVQLPPY